MTRFAAERGWSVDSDGKKHWLVVVKATFDVKADGSLQPADEQVPPLQAPTSNGEEGVSSVQFDMEVVGLKPGTDVYVVGSAFAPNGAPAKEFPISLQVGTRKKTLIVSGERRWIRTGGEVHPSDPAPFTERPVIYEHAYGGYDDSDPDPRKQKLFTRNPVGTGCITDRTKLLGEPAPSIAFPGADPEASPAAGFGAIAAGWEPRANLAGTYDAKWIEDQKPFLPHDFDSRHYMCAPEDQQFVPYLRGGEPVAIVNMSLDGVVKFEVPKRYFSMETAFGKRLTRHRAFLTSLVVEPAKRRTYAIWTSSLEVPPSQVDRLDATTIREREYQSF
jgi:hypothetical protein